MKVDLYTLSKENRPIIIYGASVVGEVVYKYLVSNEVDVKAFCDNNPVRCGQVLSGKEIISYDQCIECFPGAVLLVCMNDVKFVYRQTEHSAGVVIGETDLLIEDILKDGEYLESDLQKDRHLIRYSLRTCASAQKYYQDLSKLYIRTLQLLVTERCSLKCAECSNLIQYYKNPRDCDYDLTLQTIERVSELFDEIGDMHIIGGEPFMNLHIADFISEIDRHDNIQNIIIFTNGTIVPNEEILKACEKEKVIINISNYGKLSRNLDRLVLELNNRGIHHNVYNDLKWEHHSIVKDYGLNEEQTKQRLRLCRSAVNCTSVGEGKLFRCYYANHACRLHAVPEHVNEYIDIFNPSVKKTDIYDFLNNKDYFEICRWCRGSGFTSESLEPAVQTKAILDYIRYTYLS